MSDGHKIILTLTLLILALVTTLLSMAFEIGHGPIDIFGRHLYFHQDNFKATSFAWLGLLLSIAGILIMRSKGKGE
jgi:uncharacterized membrane protein YdcZ (DUF606 family)